MERQKPRIPVKTIAYSAMLAAISVVLARLIIPMPNEFTRFSIEAIPIFLAGMFFGPVVGGCVGFAADLVGCLFSAYGYNPIFCLPPVLYGVFGGIFTAVCKNKTGIISLSGMFALPVVLGSVLYQSCALAFVYRKEAILEGVLFFLGTRSIQFSVTLVLDVALIYGLLRSRIFHRMGLLPRRKDNRS